MRERRERVIKEHGSKGPMDKESQRQKGLRVGGGGGWAGGKWWQENGVNCNWTIKNAKKKFN